MFENWLSPFHPLNPEQENDMRLKTLVMTLVSLFCLLGASVCLAGEALLMATTTSTNDTGILDAMKPVILKETGIELNWLSKGTGQALELGKNCDADVLFVHAPAAEKKFVDDGFGVDRTQIMFNDFVLLGPANDPAGVKGKGTAEALKTLAEKKAVFVSRGDDSGTHKAELGLWKKSGLPVPDKESWYVQAGQGMLATITVASERNGYVLADRGTYFTYESKAKEPMMKILVEGDALLRNQYSVIAVNPQKCPKAKYELSKKLKAWLASPAGQKFIADFKTNGKSLFVPNAGK
jgi:tungstate transport system substrate-binding protein